METAPKMFFHIFFSLKVKHWKSLHQQKMQSSLILHGKMNSKSKENSKSCYIETCLQQMRVQRSTFSYNYKLYAC